MPDLKFLEGERIRLTVFTDDDVEPLAEWLADMDLQCLVNPGPLEPITADELKDEDSWLSQDRNSPNSYLLAIRTKAEDTFIGVVALSNFNRYARHLELGINIAHPDYRGQGYGTEVMETILRYGFAELNLNRVFLNVFSYNEPARRLYEKMGFVQEVVKREWIYYDGQMYDEITMGLLRSEWEARHAG